MHKILVVDDEPDVELMIRQKFRQRIRSGEWDFRFALSGVAALEKLAEEPDISAVLTDINMPEMDGLTLLTALGGKGMENRSVVISAYGDMTNIRTAMNRGAFDFITKPINFDDLAVTIEKTLRHAERMQEADRTIRQLEALRRELEVAAHLQQAILPRSFPTTERLSLMGQMIPAREVGGDFLDVIPLPGGRYGLVVADVSGKGLPAALFMAVARTILRSVAPDSATPAQALSRANDLLADENDSQMFVTVFYGVFDPATGVLTYANGGHNLPYVVGHDRTVTPLDESPGLVLGIESGFPFVDAVFQLEPGDLLFTYTDGITEAHGQDGSLYGDARLMDLLARLESTDPAATIRTVIAAVQAHADRQPQSDDMTCLALYWPGPGAPGSPV
ncbi:PP2C family protein-serine/threonine phosphatase [Zavarzinia sp. CC-PAN008]|uniref:PP2C family protein-serine/threonine phosphatase n=1 Tax=Zavarzinia sp. CC-PAN008 TaxID=3243332 RepID=UPI003F74A9A9